MSLLPLALQAIREGEGSPAYQALSEAAAQGDRPYPYIIAVDFDGTLLRKLGVLLVLWSCREEDDLADAVEWCRERGVEFDAANENCPCVIEYFEWNTRKIHADEYWDDRAVSICFEQEEER